MVDARLPDGSRVNAVLPPIALDGCSLTIRKFSKEPFTVKDLVDHRDADPAGRGGAGRVRARAPQHPHQRRHGLRARRRR